MIYWHNAGIVCFNTKKVRLKRFSSRRLLSGQPSFNTKKVRLKQELITLLAAGAARFNTKKVRLKRLPRLQRGALPGPFQYQKGAIIDLCILN